MLEAIDNSIISMIKRKRYHAMKGRLDILKKTFPIDGSTFPIFVYILSSCYSL